MRSWEEGEQDQCQEDREMRGVRSQGPRSHREPLGWPSLPWFSHMLNTLHYAVMAPEPFCIRASKCPVRESPNPHPFLL